LRLGVHDALDDAEVGSDCVEISVAVLYPWHTKALVGHERAMSKASKANITAKVISFDNGCAASINSRPANTAKLE